MSTCECAGDLLSVLYGEATERERREFEVHVKQCASCRAEYAAFAQVRQTIGEWRDEALNRLVSSPKVAAPPQKSAVAALRQFFDLSPLWMTTAVGFAAVLFCVLAALTMDHLREPPEIARVPITKPEALYTEAEMRRIVQDEMNRQLGSLDSSPVENTVKLTSRKESAAVAKSRVAQTRRPFSRSEREQLAAELRLISSDETDLEPPDQ